MASKGCILIVDDEYLIRWSLQQNLIEHGYEVLLSASAEEALALMGREEPDLILLDIQLPGMSGMELLKSVKATHPECAVIMITATADLAVAVQAMKDGAFDYLPKPFNLDQVRLTVDKALETRRLRDEVARLRESQGARHGFDGIVARSRAMREVLSIAAKIAGSDVATVLLTGESGTGKDLLAQAIHNESARCDMPFMPVNCTALPRDLLESELMGYERGAFTDAKTLKKGLFELVDGGTLFLDEIGDMDLALQAKLLRFLENRSFKRVGGTRDIHVDIRVIAATNRDLETRIRERGFREDLYYRLNVIPIKIPPLREHPEDILPLAEHFLALLARDLGKAVRTISPAAARAIREYPWPGNARELKNLIERAVILTGGNTLEADDFHLPSAQPVREEEGGLTLNLEDMERRLIRRAMETARGNQSSAARLLGVSRDTLRYRLRKFEFPEGEASGESGDA